MQRVCGREKCVQAKVKGRGQRSTGRTAHFFQTNQNGAISLAERLYFFIFHYRLTAFIQRLYDRMNNCVSMCFWPKQSIARE